MYSINCKGRLIVVDKPLVMGIINITPDSFYAGSRIQKNDVLKAAEQMLSDGADILDIGGQSTRPGSVAISADEELARVTVAIESIHSSFPEAIISIDTYYGLVAKQAIEAGASIVNDISAGSIDPSIIDVVAHYKTPYVLMHMKGTPATMKEQAVYENVVTEVLDFLIAKKNELQRRGINDIIIDPGFGFAKTIEHNFQLINKLEVFKMLEAPLLLGISRKSMIWKTLGTTPAESLYGTSALHAIGLYKGANILRVHDVKEAKQVVRLVAEMNKV